jgi:hypothetical protein
MRCIGVHMDCMTSGGNPANEIMAKEKRGEKGQRSERRERRRGWGGALGVGSKMGSGR